MNRILPGRVVIREVGPRDGLQGESPLPPESRARIISALLDAGVRHVEAVSFVSPKAVPAMDRPQDVLSLISPPPEVTLTALVPNLKGARMALEAGIAELTVTVAASPAYNERNVRMSIDRSVDVIGEITEEASRAGVPVDAVVSCAFGSPYEGDIPSASVASLVRRILEAGASAITLADTTGMATPRVLSAVLDSTREVVEGSGADVGLHMHETRGTGLLNCFAGLEEGISRFDTSIGGLGGSPFAEGASGNVSTEDFVALLDDLGIESGVDLRRLIQASSLVEQIVGHALESRVARVGPRSKW